MAIFTHGSCDIHESPDITTPLYTIPENMHITRYSMPFGTINFMDADFANQLYNTVKTNADNIIDGDVSSLRELIQINANGVFGELQEMEYNLSSAKYDYKKDKTEENLKEVIRYANEVRERKLYDAKAEKSYSTPKIFGPYQQILDKTFIINPDETKIYGKDANSITAITRERYEIRVIPYTGNDMKPVYHISLSDALAYLSYLGYNDIIILDYSCSDIYVDRSTKASHREKYQIRKKVWPTAKKHGGKRKKHATKKNTNV